MGSKKLDLKTKKTAAEFCLLTDSIRLSQRSSECLEELNAVFGFRIAQKTKTTHLQFE